MFGSMFRNWNDCAAASTSSEDIYRMISVRTRFNRNANMKKNIFSQSQNESAAAELPCLQMYYRKRNFM